jgi:hypothetical protein
LTINVILNKYSCFSTHSVKKYRNEIGVVLCFQQRKPVNAEQEPEEAITA